MNKPTIFKYYLATSLESNHRTEHDYQYLRSFITEPTSFSPQKLSTDLDLDIGLICGSGSCYTKRICSGNDCQVLRTLPVKCHKLTSFNGMVQWNAVNHLCRIKALYCDTWETCMLQFILLQSYHYWPTLAHSWPNYFHSSNSTLPQRLSGKGRQSHAVCTLQVHQTISPIPSFQSLVIKGLKTRPPCSVQVQFIG